MPFAANNATRRHQLATAPLPILLALLALLPLLHGCTHPPQQGASNPRAEVNSLSLLESQLLDIIQRQQTLEQDAALSSAQIGDIQRRFHQLSNDYAALIARSPDHLESRLLYGKFLAAFGDREGALDQFLIAARIDPNIAVIHQQIGNYFAEEGDYSRALAYALNAVQLEPSTAAYHFGLAELLFAFRTELIDNEVFSSDQLDAQMLSAFQIAAQLEPDNPEIQFRYGEAFYDTANPPWEQALQHWQKLPQSLPLSPLMADAVRLHQARALIALQRHTEASERIAQVSHPALQQSASELLAESIATREKR